MIRRSVVALVNGCVLSALLCACGSDAGGGSAPGSAALPSAGSSGFTSGSVAGSSASSAGAAGASAGGSSVTYGGTGGSGAGGSGSMNQGGAAQGGSNNAGSAGRMNGSGGANGNAGNGGGSAGAPNSSTGAFSQCRFHFGSIDSQVKKDNQLVSQVDFFTPGWIGQSDKFDMAAVCGDADKALVNAVPVMVSYIIAFTARRDANLQDCNVSGGNNLCTAGATFIRAHHDRIISQYKMYAQGFASSCGTKRPLIWEMEPDFYQYSVGGDPKALSAAEAGTLMTELITTVQQSLPNAYFSLDVSPWMPNNGKDWYSHFDLTKVSFINTSGGGTEAGNTKIRSANAMTWAGVHQVTGKPILADTGYGVAGSPAGHDNAWDDVNNINARIADGVVGISQYNPKSGWQSTITQNRSKLNKPSGCN